MEDKKENGYPVYTEDELGMIQQVASGSDCTGLEPKPPITEQEAKAYTELYNIPKQTEKVNNEFQEINPKKRLY